MHPNIPKQMTNVYAYENEARRRSAAIWSISNPHACHLGNNVYAIEALWTLCLCRDIDISNPHACLDQIMLEIMLLEVKEKKTTGC